MSRQANETHRRVRLPAGEDTALRFMLVNQERPCHGAVCSACARPLGSSYVRHVSKQERYCDQDCYRRDQQTAMELLWPYRSSLEVIAVLAAISSWSWMMQMGALSRSLTEAYLRAHDLLTTEGGDG
ncbi:collagenase-like PrtC family protease [Bradyrhizobium diazoefficiens]